MISRATFAGGCFWCTEAVYKRIKGVVKVTPGYSGGKIINPTYEEVCSGLTGHAEAVQIEYDPALIDYEELLEVFFATHDPTTLNQQGNDIGTQYRSVIFFHDKMQKEKAVILANKLNRKKIYNKAIVTEIIPFDRFYPAEDYHRDYYERNQDQNYCRVVIVPKLKKLADLRLT